MDDATATEIMQRFGRAFFKRDRKLLSDILCDDAEWHFAFGADAPDGRVRKGVDGFLRGIEENDALFERLRFADVQCFGLAPDRIVMTYVAQGKYRDGVEFSLRGIELLTVRDGRIAKKDVFWKQERA
ncbi:MAG: nuclear transport factor 2 family protein [Burkholderiales bacterium]|nr:nuclear transport factor 2 family protein [Burkholderiales bacterium]